MFITFRKRFNAKIFQTIRQHTVVYYYACCMNKLGLKIINYTCTSLDVNGTKTLYTTGRVNSYLYFHVLYAIDCDRDFEYCRKQCLGRNKKLKTCTYNCTQLIASVFGDLACSISFY